MRRVLPVIALGTMLGTTGLHAANYCDDKIDPGESPDGPALMTMGALMMNILAETYCGASPMAPLQIIVVVEERHGCGPRERLESEIKERLKGVKPVATIGEFLHELDPASDEPIPQADLDSFAKAAIDEYGGCSKLLQVRGEFEQQYRNPPTWPRKSGQ